MERRAVLTAGGAAVLVIGAGGGLWSISRAPRKARAPWRRADESLGDPRLDALAFAILAPNPHNMQPWRVRLDGDDALFLYCDPDRLLPETDPLNRQIVAGLGCFLELLRQAAAENGHLATFDYFPEGEPHPVLDGRPIARVAFQAAQTAPAPPRDPLFESALTRRTNRRPFDADRPPGGPALAAIRSATVDGVRAFTTADPTRVAALRELAVDAWRTEWAHAPTRRESIVVTRIGKAEINASPFGLALQGPVMEGLGVAGVLTRENLDDPQSQAFKQSQLFYERACRTSAAFLWTTTATNTRADQLEAGRAWIRMQLAATARGVAFHPLSQALQEFDAMRPHFERAHALLADQPGATVQMLTRLGFAPEEPPAPREPLEAVLVPV